MSDLSQHARQLHAHITSTHWRYEYLSEVFDGANTDAQFAAAAPDLVLDLADEVDELETALADANTRLAALAEAGVDAGLWLKSMNAADGDATLSVTTTGIAEAAALLMIDGLADMLDGATNYVEFDLRRRGKTAVSVCIRRYGHPTPHDLRAQAEQDRDTMTAQIRQLRDSISGQPKPGLSTEHVVAALDAVLTTTSSTQTFPSPSSGKDSH